MVSELKISVFYSAKIVAKRITGTISTAQVMIELKDLLTKSIELWTVNEFRSKFGIMLQEYQDNKANHFKNLQLSSLTPFKINKDAMQTIGYSTIVLKAIYFNMDVNVKAGIISNTTGTINGQLTVNITPLWSSEQQEEEALNADTIHDITDLHYLDLEINFIQAEALPAILASDCRIKYSFPNFIHCLLLPEDYKEKKYSFSELNEKISSGMTYITPSNPATLDQLIINPILNYKRVIRLYDLNYKIKEWFKNADLILEVIGEAPPSQITNPIEQQQQAVDLNRSISIDEVSNHHHQKVINKIDQTHDKLKNSRNALRNSLIENQDYQKIIKNLELKISQMEQKNVEQITMLEKKLKI